MPTIDDLHALGIRAGKILEVRHNEQARVPAYVLRIDFGPHGVKTSSAQITDLYTPEDLVGRLILGVTNLPPRSIAGVESEVLVTGFYGEHGVVLVGPDQDVPIGTRLA